MMEGKSSEPTAICMLEVQVVIFSLREGRLQVLLQPAREFPRHWQLPGNGLLPGQSLEETASQCMADYICHQKGYLEQLYTYGDPGRHPARRMISVVYFALVPADAYCQPAGKDEVDWFPVDGAPRLALDTGEVLAYALRRLRYKLEYTAAGFELLPETFTLSELQRTYEMILGEKLDKRNFRRRILEAGIIEPTSVYRGGEGRPALLYRYRPDAVAEVKARRLFP